MLGPAGDKGVNIQNIWFYDTYIVLRGNGGGKNTAQKALYNTTSHPL